MWKALPALLLCSCVCATNGIADDSKAIERSGMHQLTVAFTPDATVPEDFVLSIEMNAFQPGDAYPITLIVSQDGAEIGRQTSNLPQVLVPDAQRCDNPCVYDVEVMLDFDDARQLTVYAGKGPTSASYDCIDRFVTMAWD